MFVLVNTTVEIIIQQQLVVLHMIDQKIALP
jgi:hypothetical protein